ncbi:MAG: hypothetical protein OXE76_15435 [Alphaproteobacteria bacterium]|nr:hypothetical protein [Alphaproteobacteria bacterium]
MSLQQIEANPTYAFCPSYDFPDEPQEIRIVFLGHPGYISTSLSTRNLEEAERLCDRMNARLGMSRPIWSALMTASMEGHPLLFN